MSALNRAFPHAFVRGLMPLAVAVIVATVASPLRAQQLIAPDATIASFSQSYLSGRWVQWLASYTTPTNPALDTTGEHSAAGDQGSYFFLAGSFSPDPVVRSVTVRANQTLFFPLVDVISVIPYYGSTEAEIRADASDTLGIASNLSVTVDSAPALLPAGFSSLDQFRQYSTLFPMTFIDDNIFGIAPAVLDAVSDGYFVGLEALPQGVHELRFTAHIDGVGAYAGSSFSQDITYQVTSVPEPGTWAMMCLGLAAVVAGAARRRRDRQAR